MTSEATFAVPKTLLAPLPETERGYGIHVDITKKDYKLAYCNNNNVVIRSLENPSVAELFVEHKTRVHVAKFSPNGEWVASGDDKGRVMIWGVKSKLIKLTVQVGRKITDISWSDDGQRLVAVGDGNELLAKAFTWDSGNSLGDIIGHSKTILSAAFKPGRPFRITTCGEDNAVNFYTGPPFKFTSSFTGHSKFVNCVRYSHDGKMFATVGADSKIFLFDGTSGEKIKEIESKDNHSGSIYSFCWSPDNKQILTAGADKTCKLWNVEDGSLVKTFTLGKNVDDMQVSVAWEGPYIISVSLSGAINYLDLDNPAAPKLVLHGHQQPVIALEADAKTGLAFSSDQIGRVTRWDLAKLEGHWMEGKGHGKGVVGLAFDRNRDSLYTVGMDDKLRVNALKGNHFSDSAVTLPGMPTGIAMGHKHDLAVVSIAQGKLVVFDKGHIVSTTEVKFRPNCVALSKDDTEVAVGEDKKIHVYSLDNHVLKPKYVLEGHLNLVDSVSYSPSGLYLVSGDRGRVIYVWDLSTKQYKNSNGWCYHSAKITNVCWAPNSSRLASGSLDQNIIVWTDADDFAGNSRQKLEFAHGEGVLSISFLDDNTLISIGGDRAVKIWSV